MSQPIKREIREAHPDVVEQSITTLLIDGSNILEVCFNASKEQSTDGRDIGAIRAFLVQLRIMLKKGHFRYIYCFFDGEYSGQRRYELYHDYKANRPDKVYRTDTERDNEELSDYAKAFDANLKSMQDAIYNKKKRRSEHEKANYLWQQEILLQCLEELFIRCISVTEVESDDLIAYYVKHKKAKERIVIMSNDRDLTQLVSDDVIVYVQKNKDFVNAKNSVEKLGVDYRNMVLKKVLCGDASDNIKGIKGVGETTLLKNFPELRERKVQLDEIVGKAMIINEERAKEKKKPLQWAYNIVNKVTDGIQGEDIYTVNERIIDLSNPLVTEEGKEVMDTFMHAPLDPEGRSTANLHRILCNAGIEQFKDEQEFSRFFEPFEYHAAEEGKKF